LILARHYSRHAGTANVAPMSTERINALGSHDR
jgi:hypothetical protein